MTLKEQLLKYLQEHEGMHASGELQRLLFPKYAYGEHRGYFTPSTVTRELRRLAESGEIIVEHRKNHSWYAGKKIEKPVSKVVVIEGIAYEIT